ncbi:phytanoyl-CoA dioxygenase family protein [Acinetobacter sp. MB5]|uniref:phytanoyl-CoA dioxygenase family protein n=1 Tax=Acinetobacter sp. MB5 TaxID=2069438 RepID=UPI00196AEEFC|nr:phytanoyl-CoA dioxygenase family protein [Acinetobacter sp. MB5]
MKKIKKFLQQERTQRALNEFKQLLQQHPKQTLFDSMTLFTSAKSFEKNSLLGNPVFNELGLHRYRVKKAAEMATKRREKLAVHLETEDVAQFEQNGFILKENFLDDAQFQALKAELLATPLQTRETLQGDTVTRRMALDQQALKQLPVTTQLLASSNWQNLLNYVGSFKVQPVYYLQMIFSHVRDARPDPQTNLHSDTFHPSVKAWLFLEDVAEDEGPFVYVPGSHRVTEQRLAWEYQKSLSIHAKTEAMTRRGSFRVQQDELTGLGYAEPKAFAVKANTLVVADTYGFHARGQSIHPSTRIELWAYARRNPFLPWTGFDPVALPVIKHRLIPLYWWGLDYLEEKFQQKSPWRDIGKKSATDPVVVRKK